MLKRNNPPLNWCPPYGRVENGERFIDAAIRETFEEASIIVDKPKLVDVWHDNLKIVSAVFAYQTTTRNVILSNEHSDYKWLTSSELRLIDTDFDVSKFREYIEI